MYQIWNLGTCSSSCNKTKFAWLITASLYNLLLDICCPYHSSGDTNNRRLLCVYRLSCYLRLCLQFLQVSQIFLIKRYRVWKPVQHKSLGHVCNKLTYICHSLPRCRWVGLPNMLERQWRWRGGFALTGATWSKRHELQWVTDIECLNIIIVIISEYCWVILQCRRNTRLRYLAV